MKYQEEIYLDESKQKIQLHRFSKVGVQEKAVTNRKPNEINGLDDLSLNDLATIDSAININESEESMDIIETIMKNIVERTISNVTDLLNSQGSYLGQELIAVELSSGFKVSINQFCNYCKISFESDSFVIHDCRE